MIKVESFIEKHFAWIASVVIAIGFYIAILQGQSQAIDQLKVDMHQVQTNITQLEKCIIKLELIEKSLDEVKIDLKQIKGILYKPVIAKCDDPDKTVEKNL